MCPIYATHPVFITIIRKKIWTNCESNSTRLFCSTCFSIYNLLKVLYCQSVISASYQTTAVSQTLSIRIRIEEFHIQSLIIELVDIYVFQNTSLEPLRPCLYK